MPNADVSVAVMQLGRGGCQAGVLVYMGLNCVDSTSDAENKAWDGSFLGLDKLK